MNIPKKTEFRRSPKPTTAARVIGVANVVKVKTPARVGEKIPRDWTVKKPDFDFINLIFVKCNKLAKEMHGTGELALAVYDHEPPQLAFFWLSQNDDLFLIFPTHSKVKCEFTKSDLENLKKSFTWGFENSLAFSLLKKRNIGFQFLRIEKFNGDFNYSLSPVIFANLWEKIYDNEVLPKEHSLNDKLYIEGEYIVSRRTTKIFAINNSHEYRIPLNRISETMKKVIVERNSFARIVPHGHIHMIRGEKLIDRSPNVPHPYLHKILKEYKGRAVFLKCVQCGSSMVGFFGETMCALCKNSVEPLKQEDVYSEHGHGYFKVIRKQHSKNDT